MEQSNRKMTLKEITLEILQSLCESKNKEVFFNDRANYISKNFEYGIFNGKFELIRSQLRDVAKHINNFAVVLREKQEYQSAKPLFEISLNITEVIYGRNDRTTAFHFSNLAVVMNGLKRFKEANDLFQKDLEIMEKCYSKKHQGYSIHLQRWGDALMKQKDYKKAIEKYSEAAEIFEEVGHYEHPELLNQIVSCSNAHFMDNDFRGAIKLLKRKYNKFMVNLTDSHPHTIKIKETLDSLKTKI